MQALPFGLGLVEGFYGRQWNDADRLACLGFLAGIGYRYYLYAPKGDAILRRDWGERWRGADEERMRALADCCARIGVRWGFGLSPLGLVEDASPAARRRLRDKVRYLESFGAGIQCVLFDDMPRHVDALAARQLDIVADVMAVSRAEHLLLCPSYYSSDPVLEKLFGTRPAGYWEDLGAALPPEAGVFWTGDRVCAEAHEVAALAAIGVRLRRKPVLWDNYPVNDGARGANFLRVDAFRGRSHALAGVTQAHFVNPMNQCWLSRIPLQTLAMQYAQGARYDPEAAFLGAAAAQCGPALGAMLHADRDTLQRTGLEAMGEEQRARLHARYLASASPYAHEICEWLEGGYAFDPACLTG